MRFIHNHVQAQLQLGLLALGDEQNLPNYQEAFKWFRAATTQNDAEAEYQLGLLYEKVLAPKQITMKLAIAIV